MQLLFIDTLNALASELESNAIHIITHPKKTSEKIEAFTMQLVEFKCSVLSVIQGFVRDQKGLNADRQIRNEQIIQDVRVEVERNQDRLHRYRLHQILKRKIDRQKRESMLGSVLVEENQSFVQLERSMIMIQKDLGIQNQLDNLSERLGLSTVISRSLLGDSPLKNDKLRDDSMISQVSSLPHDTSLSQFQKMQTPQTIPKENLQTNMKETRNQQQKEMKPSKKGTVTAKKSKKTVFSKTDASKQGLLGNLLEETFQSCLEKK